nr:retrovirus-related Pol polyprotein from transposon TNT 1-94 [Tanacetum cinerariifolium]
VILVSSASGSISQDNIKKNRIQRTQRKAKKNKVEDHLRTVKSSFNKKSVVDSKATSSVINSVSNVNSDLKCASCNGCLFSDNHDACVVDYIRSVNASRKSKSVTTPGKRKVWKPTRNVFKTVGHIWKPTGRTFKLVGNVCPLTRIATPTIVRPREPIPLVNSMDKPVVTLVYTRKPKAANKKVHNKLDPTTLGDPQVPMFLLHFLTAGCPNRPLVLGLRVLLLLMGGSTISYYYEEVGISHETSVAPSPQQNGVVKRRNRTLIEAARTMLIYAQDPLFLWAEDVATACFTQNRSIIRLGHGKTPYELLHNKLSDLSFFYVFGALCYPTNDSENLGKLQPKADIGIFIGYAPTKKAFRVYNRRTRRIVETIHVDFDELTAMASEQSNVGNDNLDMEVAHMGNDPLLGVPILKVTSEQYSSTASPRSIISQD